MITEEPLELVNSAALRPSERSAWLSPGWLLSEKQQQRIGRGAKR